MIADNKLSLNATWNEDLLAAELKQLSETEFHMELLGFSEIELERYLNSDLTAIDAASE